MIQSAGWPHIPEPELAAFHKMADVFLNTANALVGEEPPDRIAAAFIYAGTRFAAFTLQAVAGEDAEVAPAQADALVMKFEVELRDNMAQQLRSEAGAPAAQGQVPDAAIDVLMSVNGMDQTSRSAFLQLADRFVRPANGLIAEHEIPRVSAALLHACTRFNAFVLQARGLPPGPLEDAVADDFRGVFRALLTFHLDQSVITDRDG